MSRFHLQSRPRTFKGGQPRGPGHGSLLVPFRVGFLSSQHGLFLGKWKRTPRLQARRCPAAKHTARASSALCSSGHEVGRLVLLATTCKATHVVRHHMSSTGSSARRPHRAPLMETSPPHIYRAICTAEGSLALEGPGWHSPGGGEEGPIDSPKCRQGDRNGHDPGHDPQEFLSKSLRGKTRG